MLFSVRCAHLAAVLVAAFIMLGTPVKASVAATVPQVPSARAASKPSTTPSASSQASQPNPQPSPSSTPPSPHEGLDQKKLREEIRKLRIENDRSESVFGGLLAAAPFITALVAILTLGFTARNSRRESARQRSADRRQRKAEMQQRFDEIFTDAIKNLSSSDDAVRAAGAASMLRVSDTAKKPLQREVLIYVAAQLRLGVSEKVSPILKEVFEKAAAAVFSDSDSSMREVVLRRADLSGIRMRNLSFRRAQLDLTEANLSGADLYESDMWSAKAPKAVLAGADCRKLNLGPADLREADLRRAQLAGAKMASSKLQGADLSGADLRGAKLQSAHFERAILIGVDFAFADVNDAYFTDAVMDVRTIETLRSAKNADKAHPPQVGTTLTGDETVL